MHSSHLSKDATRCVHAGEDRHGIRAPITTPIAQTSVFVLPDVEDLRRSAQGKSDAYLYTRYANPTTAVAEQKIAALEGAEECVVTSSGMAAVLCAVLAGLKAGDEIVSMLDIYGGTLRLFEEVLPQFGITSRLVPHAGLSQVERYFSARTAMLFLESPTNPILRCADLASLAAVAHQRNIAVLVDNTFATPILQKPLALGADMVMHSATKYLGGHSDVTAGAVAGSHEWMVKVRERMKLTGGCLDPLCSYLLIRGLKTLEIRVERACHNARLIAEFLCQNARVEQVHYPGLPSHAAHALVCRQMRNFGMMLAFDIKGAHRGIADGQGAAAEVFINRLQLWYLATSLGGVESTVSYPILSSHAGLSDDRLHELGVSPATIRLSVGIESATDLIADLEQALGI
ncbi:MAG: PLP-dependent aspartate aminotransferase family protein [Terriglobales bacterium]|jgi:cystathionine beta-lyase/cystathionine gamma-synthase